MPKHTIFSRHKTARLQLGFMRLSKTTRYAFGFLLAICSRPPNGCKSAI